MTIQPSAIVLYESERMTDEATGGGRPTGNIIPDNTLNAIFPKTSRRDRTEGRFNMTKVFGGVRSATAEAYQGTHFAITKDAQDQNVNVLCIAGTPTDTRDEARARIEAYLVPGISARMYMLGDAYAKQRSILTFQDVSTPLPELGSTLYLKQQDKDGNTVSEDYVKISGISDEVQTFTYEFNNQFGTLQRRVLTIKLASRLKYALIGGYPYPTGSKRDDNQVQATVSTTNIADATQFYGCSALAVDAAVGQSIIRVSEVYKPIVPSAYAENIITEQLALGELSQLVAAGDSISQSVNFALVSGTQSRTYLPRIPMRGAVLTIDSGVYKDDGTGQLKLLSGTDNFSQIQVSYETGQIDAWRKSSVFVGAATVTFTPAARLLGSAISRSTPVTKTNRTFSWVWMLPGAVPELGTVSIWYRSMGNWQLIQDDGSGKLTGAGTGSITPSGSISASFNSLPDVDTSIVLAWLPKGSMEYTALGGQSKSIAKQQIINTGYAIDPHSLILTWVTGGVTKTLSDNGSGLLLGDIVGQGSISYAGKQLKFVPTGLPDTGTYQLSYTRAAYGLVSITIPDDPTAAATFNAGKPLSAGKSVITYSVVRRTSSGGRASLKVTITDDGAGKLLRDGVQVGTIDYATGSGSFTWAQDYSYTVTSYTDGQFGTQSIKEVINASELATGAGTLQGLPSAEASGTTENMSVNMPELEFTVAENLITSSLMFTDNGNIYIERDGVLWKNPDPRTGAGTRVGRVESGSGTVIISDAKGITGNLFINAGASLNSRPFIGSAIWRTPGAPIKAANLEVKGQDAHGAIFKAALLADGSLSGSLGSGSVDISSGLVTMSFSRPIAANSLVYSTVILTSIPLDSDAIGLDPVRLPPDGKVPIFSDGVGVVIGHTGTLNVGTPTAGLEVDCGRDYLAELWFTDSAGKKLSAAQYTENRDAGLVTMKSPLSLVDAAGTALTPPLTLHHRIEHRTLLLDVQPNGDLSLAIPLQQAYPAGASYVSSYLPQGDRYASWGNLFTQQTWDTAKPNWGHTPVGTEILADYNAIDFPPEVNNEGTVDDEWLIKFSSATTFDVISRDRGLISSGTTGTDLTLVNPNTGTPYLVLRKGGWSAGWVTGNVLRLTTISALAPIWLLRCVSIGVATHPDDQFEYMQYGDGD